MAFIPKIQSKQQVSKENVMLQRQPDYYDAQQADRIGSMLMQFGKNIEDIEAFRQTSNAKLAAQSELAEIKSEALANPDLTARESYYERIDQAVSKIGDGISNKRARDQFMFQGRSLATSTKADIKLKTYQESIAMAKDNLKLSANVATDLAINSNDEQTVNAATVDYYTNLEQAVSSGLITEAERDLRIDAFVEQVRIGQVDRAIMEDAATAVERIEADEFGLNASEKAKKLGQARSAARKQLELIKYEEKAAQLETGRNLVNELINTNFQQYTPSQVDNMRAQGLITEEVATLSKRLIRSNPVNAYNDIMELNRLDIDRSNILDEESDLSDNQKIDLANETLIGYMKLFADGKMTPQQFQRKAGAVQMELQDMELMKANRAARKGFRNMLAQVTTGAMGMFMHTFSDMIDNNTLKNQKTSSEQLRSFLLQSAQAEDPNMTEERMDAILSGEDETMNVFTYNTETGVFE